MWCSYSVNPWRRQRKTYRLEMKPCAHRDLCVINTTSRIFSIWRQDARTGTEVFSRQNAAAHLKCNEGPVSVKSRELLRARKAGCQTSICLLWAADLLTCFYCKKNQEDCMLWWLRTSALQRHKGNFSPQKGPEKLRDLWETDHSGEKQPDSFPPKCTTPATDNFPPNTHACFISSIDDPHWCSIKINGQRRYTGEETGEEPWTHHVSLLVYHLHADQVKAMHWGKSNL